ncbi:MAG: DMT family transporter [Mesorhizobium sp.]
MSASATDRGSNDRPLTAIGLKITSICIFVAMQAFIKLAGQLPTGQISFFRSFFALFPIVLYLLWQGQLRGALHTQRPWGHAYRGIVGVASMMFGFFALTRLPLPEAIMLNYAQPLLVIVISALLLGETVRIYRWSAVAVGFIGVFIIVWPNLTLFRSGEGLGSAEGLGVAAALIAAGISAVAMIQVSSLVATEKTATIVLYFSITSSVVALLTIPFGWSSLSAWQATCLILCGFCGGVAQIFMTEAYRYGSAATVAPFEYSSIIIGSIVGYMIFSDLPTPYSIVGGAIVISAGLFILWREHKLGLQRGRAKGASPPSV